jgi:hypothetical protein
MNQLVTTNRNTPAIAEPLRTGSLAIGEALATAEAALIVDTKAERPWTDETFHELWRLTDPRDLCGRGAHQQCQRALALAPAAGSLEAFIRRLEIVAAATPDRRTTRRLIGLLVDAFPNGRPADFYVYCESLLHDAMSLEFSPQVVATACRILRRTVRFLPTVAEFVETCEAQRKEIRAALHYAQRLQERLAKAAEIVAAS